MTDGIAKPRGEQRFTAGLMHSSSLLLQHLRVLHEVYHAGALPWAKQIIERLGVFRPDALEAWYAYFSTGEAQHFFALMQTLPEKSELPI